MQKNITLALTVAILPWGMVLNHCAPPLKLSKYIFKFIKTQNSKITNFSFFVGFVQTFLGQSRCGWIEIFSKHQTHKFFSKHQTHNFFI